MYSMSSSWWRLNFYPLFSLCAHLLSPLTITSRFLASIFQDTFTHDIWWWTVSNRTANPYQIPDLLTIPSFPNNGEMKRLRDRCARRILLALVTRCIDSWALGDSFCPLWISELYLVGLDLFFSFMLLQRGGYWSPTRQKWITADSVVLLLWPRSLFWNHFWNHRSLYFSLNFFS